MKFAFLNVGLQSSSSQPVQYFADVTDVVRIRFRVYQDIVQIDYTEIVQVINQHIIYIPLIRSWAITKSKRQYLQLIRSITSAERCVLFRVGVYLNLIKGSANIQLRKNLSFIRTSQQFVYSRYQISIFLSNRIQLIVVYTDTEVFVRLPNTQDRGGEQAVT